ncbi:MAG: cyanophycinase [Bacteroidetes bacterium]|nr:cyanophycinase [Bacteroidota bacterium]
MRLSKNKYHLPFILCALLFFSAALFSAPKGKLLIIGGGERTDEIMKKFFELAGGKNAVVVVFPMASGDAEETGIEQSRQIRDLGVKQSFYLNITKEQANSDSILQRLNGVTGVFYSGGDQVLLTKALKGTKTEQRVREIYNAGGVISGTSAGAAVMSEIMITGEELINKDSSAAFSTLLTNNVEYKTGFGFVTDAIIDQHFVVRKRHNRLISLVLENPKLLGVGIDESTSILVYPNKTFEVIGESVVCVYDATEAKNISTNKNNYLSANSIKLHILRQGQKFDLLKKKVIQ